MSKRSFLNSIFTGGKHKYVRQYARYVLRQQKWNSAGYWEDEGYLSDWFYTKKDALHFVKLALKECQSGNHSITSNSKAVKERGVTPFYYSGDMGFYIQEFPGWKFVNVYLTDRAFGGSEEGGWWYDCGTLVESTELPKEWQAAQFKKWKEEQYDLENKDRNSNVGSVCSDGKYVVELDWKKGENYPKYRPHYE